MSSLEARFGAKAAGDVRPPLASVFYTFAGVESGSWVPLGMSRWDIVARAVAGRLGCKVRAEEPPIYDVGTRIWTLELTILRRWRRARILPVTVRWG